MAGECTSTRTARLSRVPTLVRLEGWQSDARRQCGKRPSRGDDARPASRAGVGRAQLRPRAKGRHGRCVGGGAPRARRRSIRARRRKHDGATRFSLSLRSSIRLGAGARLRFPGESYVDSCELSVLGWSGAGEKDLAEIEQALRRTEASGSWPLIGGMFPVGRFWLAAVLARSGRRDSAWAVLRDTRATVQREGHGMDYMVNDAQVLVILGEPERALDLLEQAVHADPALRARIGRTPWFDALRQSPRFVRLIQGDVPPSTR